MLNLVLVPLALTLAVIMTALAVMRRSTTGWGAAGWASGAALCVAAAVFHDQLATVVANFPCPCGAPIPDGGPDLLR